MKFDLKKSFDYENKLEKDAPKRQFWDFDAKNLHHFWPEKSSGD
jgi:hypothetical protein